MDTGPNDMEAKPVAGPIVHVRADSDSTLEALFDIALKPPGTQTHLQVAEVVPSYGFKGPFTQSGR
jgi:hypothetical protein